MAENETKTEREEWHRDYMDWWDMGWYGHAEVVWVEECARAYFTILFSCAFLLLNVIKWINATHVTINRWMLRRTTCNWRWATDGRLPFWVSYVSEALSTPFSSTITIYVPASRCKKIHRVIGEGASSVFLFHFPTSAYGISSLDGRDWRKNADPFAPYSCARHPLRNCEE